MSSSASPAKSSFRPINPFIAAVILSLAYWIYLLFASHPYIKYDAETFRDLGTILSRNGWADFFKTEPNYVPIYPLLISLSMRAANLFSISYLPLQVVIQIAFLLITQILIFRVLKRLHINEYLIATIILYFGFSPAVVNSGFSLYSEIATYPFVLLVILASVNAWESIQGDHLIRVLSASMVLSSAFLLVTMANAAFEYILPVFMFSFLCLSVRFLIRNQRKYFAHALVFILASLFIFHLALTPYKLMNLKYNGYKSLVIKGAWSFYANTTRRTEQLTSKQFLVALAYVPGEGVCREIFGEEDCSFWSIGAQHGIGISKLKELQAQGVSNKDIDSILMGLSKEKILQKPLQYTFLATLESLKMFFWESTKVGYVFYPAWLEKIYDITLFKNGLRLAVALLTFFSFLYLIRQIWRHRIQMYQTSKNEINTPILFFAFVMLVSYIGLHAFFCIATRYTFPIISLYLICIANFFHKIISRQS